MGQENREVFQGAGRDHTVTRQKGKEKTGVVDDIDRWIIK
jgi:hypothetical protein